MEILWAALILLGVGLLLGLGLAIAAKILHVKEDERIDDFGLEPNLMKLLTAVVVAVFLGIPYIQRTYWGRAKKWRSNRKLKNGGN